MHVSIFCRYLTEKLQAQHVHGLARSNSVLKWNIVVEIIEIYRLRCRLLILSWLLRSLPGKSKFQPLDRDGCYGRLLGNQFEDDCSKSAAWVPPR